MCVDCSCWFVDDSNIVAAQAGATKNTDDVSDNIKKLQHEPMQMAQGATSSSSPPLSGRGQGCLALPFRRHCLALPTRRCCSRCLTVGTGFAPVVVTSAATPRHIAPRSLSASVLFDSTSGCWCSGTSSAAAGRCCHALQKILEGTCQPLSGSCLHCSTSACLQTVIAARNLANLCGSRWRTVSLSKCMSVLWGKQQSGEQSLSVCWHTVQSCIALGACWWLPTAVVQHTAGAGCTGVSMLIKCCKGHLSPPHLL
jgi:hypothetical protein